MRQIYYLEGVMGVTESGTGPSALDSKPFSGGASGWVYPSSHGSSESVDGLEPGVCF